MDELDIKINHIRRLIKEDMNNPSMRILAQQITKGYNTDLGKSRAIYDWIKQNLNYVREDSGLDVHQKPSITVNLGRFDCEDSTALFATLAGIVGIPTKLKVIRQTPNLWSHVYPLALTNGKFLPYDNAAPVLMEKEVQYLGFRIYDV